MQYPAILWFFCVSLFFFGCKDAQQSSHQQLKRNAPSVRSPLIVRQPVRRVAAKPAARSKKASDVRKPATRKSKYPSQALVTEIQVGDNGCYITVKDEAGKLHHLSAMLNFSPCGAEGTYLKKRVALTYHKFHIKNCAPGAKCTPPTKLIDGIKTMVLVKVARSKPALRRAK